MLIPASETWDLFFFFTAAVSKISSTNQMETNISKSALQSFYCPSSIYMSQSVHLGGQGSAVELR